MLAHAALPSMRGPALLGILLPTLAAGCLDGFQPLEGPVPAPAIAAGTWWTVRQAEWSGDDAPWRDVNETVWIVGHRDVGGVPWPLAYVVESRSPPPFAQGPFRLVLLPPGLAVAEGGMPSRPWGTPEVDCRGADLCPTAAVLPHEMDRALPFPLTGDYESSQGLEDAVWERSSIHTTGHVVGHGRRTYPFGDLDVVRIEEHRTYRGFEHGGRSDADLDYAPALGVVVRERESGCALPMGMLCGGRSGRSLDVEAHGWVPPPSAADVGNRFAVEQADLVRHAGITVDGQRANVADGEAFAAHARFDGLRAGDTVEVRFSPFTDESGYTGGPATTVPGANATFHPRRPGWYNVDALVRAPQGAQVGLMHAEARAIYDGRVPVACEPACPPVAVPMGPRVQNVGVTAHMDAALRPGRLEVRDGDGRLQGSCACAEVLLAVLSEQATDWTAQWTPDHPASRSVVTFHVAVE